MKARHMVQPDNTLVSKVLLGGTLEEGKGDSVVA